jgi:hypothetical protein
MSTEQKDAPRARKTTAKPFGAAAAQALEPVVEQQRSDLDGALDHAGDWLGANTINDLSSLVTEVGELNGLVSRLQQSRPQQFESAEQYTAWLRSLTMARAALVAAERALETAVRSV